MTILTTKNEIFNPSTNLIWFPQGASAIMDEITTVDELRPFIDDLKAYDFDNDEEDITSLMAARYARFGYVISEIIGRIVYNKIRYRYESHFDDFAYLYVLNRILFIHSNIVFILDKDDVMENGTDDLLKTYNRLVLLNKA